MASFMANFFKDKPSADTDARPCTPVKSGGAKNNFINPPSTPQGSPSKKIAPPGAHDLPAAFDTSLTLSDSTADAPLRLSRPQSVVTPLSPGRNNPQPLDETSLNVDDSIIHKTTSTGSPLRKRGQENTPPPSRLWGTDSPHQHNHAALSRQQLYEPRERPSTPAPKKFNTSRGLTAEEREILNKPNVKRMVNVTQLCRQHPLSLRSLPTMLD